ncbi:MAG TPA: beta-propeller domain-containing protein, partial [Chthoniobacteraceae bacterium]|nr:beta-propeller domain-containing protein [Chthoniobacteraceae bacterium]
MKPLLLIIVAALAIAALPAQADTTTSASARVASTWRPTDPADARAWLTLQRNWLRSRNATEPYIEAIHGRHVRVRVPAGFDRVTLQQRVLSRAPARPGGSLHWKTIATDYPRGAGKVIKIKLQTLVGERHLRVFGNKFEPLPGSLLTGLTNFLPDPLTDANGGNNPTVSVRGNPGVMTLAGTDSVTSNFKEGGGGGEPRAVVESDIWRVDGDRLYFFNELRGLQSFDLSNPDAPALLGTLRLPGSGENMYLLGSTHAVLLKPSTNWWGGWIAGDVITLRATNLSNGSQGSELIIADVRAGAPKLVTRVPVDGSIAESRLVGSVLYLATNVNRTATDTTPAEYGLQLTSFDLADPTAPVLRGSVFLGGWANAVSATDRYFLVAKYADTNGSWNSNSVDLIDISAPDGTMRRAGQALVAGNINSKFNLNIEGDVLTAVAEVWGETTVDTSHGPTTRWTNVTRLQTFSLANPDAPAPLGSVEIAPGESLRAARFDGDRAYVVTFQRIDPLFVVDLRDAAKPTIAGEVEAPGFSTYIEPLGDRLVTIGLVDWRPAVSLFDVSNPAAPTLLSQINLGNGDDWSHSEAVWNEKAFKVLPEKNLILVPVSGHGEKEGWFSRVQLLDLFRDKVVKRGAIAHEFSPRRATVMNKAVVAISPTRLVTVDASNRDEPKLLADLEIAWRVDRVFVVGRHLVQIGGSADWNDSRPPTLSVSPRNDPDDIRNLVELGDLPVIGSELNDGVLYLAQGKGRYRYYRDEPPGDDFAKQMLTVSAYDLSQLPRLRLLGKTSIETRLSTDELTAHW